MLIPRFWPSRVPLPLHGSGVLERGFAGRYPFNAVAFGSLVDAIGYRTSFLIMPACMVWDVRYPVGILAAAKLERCD